MTSNPWRKLFNYSLSTQYFSTHPPPLHFKALNATVSSATSPKTACPAHTDTRNGSFFVHWEKESHRITRSKMFNYNIIYTISMTIVTIGDKIVERVFKSSNGALFWNHCKKNWASANQWRQPNHKINVSEDKKKRCLTYKRERNSSDNVSPSTL